MKKLLSVIMLVCIVASMCSVSAWASELAPWPTGTTGTVNDAPYPLTFSMMFTAADPTDAQFNDYWLFEVDFVLKVNKDVKGTDAYVAGNFNMHDSTNRWVKHDFNTDEVVIKAGQEYYIAEDIMSGYLSGYMPYFFVLTHANPLKCGIYFEEEFLDANPDFQATLETRICNPNSREQGARISNLSEFRATPLPVNPPAPAPAAPAVENVYYIPATDDNSNMALWSILALALLTTAFVTRKRKAGN